MLRAARALAAAALLGGVIVGCSRTVEPQGNATLEDVRARSGPRPYFVGERFEELPLTAILGKAWPVTFIYGDCEVPGGTDGGCAPPLEVQVWPIEKRPPGMISAMLECRMVTVRGVRGAFYGSDLDLYVDGVTVVVFADSRARTLRAAEALRPVDAERATADGLPEASIDPEPKLQHCSDP